MSKPKPKSSHYHIRKRILRRNARKQLLKLLEKQNYKCYYCKEEIISKKWVRRNIETKDILKVDKKIISFIKNDKLFTIKIATIEHLTRIADGGNNSENNIVAACYYCNHKENNKIQSKKG